LALQHQRCHHKPQKQRLFSTVVSVQNFRGACKVTFAASLARWRQSTDPPCCCGAPQQTSSKNARWQLARFPGGLPAPHIAEDGGVVWLDTQSMRQKSDFRIIGHFHRFLLFIYLLTYEKSHTHEKKLSVQKNAQRQKRSNFIDTAEIE